MLTSTYLLPLLLLGASPEMASPPMAAMGPAPAMGAAPAMGSTAAMGARDGMWKPYDYQGGSSRQKQRIPAGTLVIIAYVIIWAVVLAYVVVLASRQARLRRDLDELAHRIGPEDASGREST